MDNVYLVTIKTDHSNTSQFTVI